jgi:hypothetical protein
MLPFLKYLLFLLVVSFSLLSSAVAGETKSPLDCLLISTSLSLDSSLNSSFVFHHSGYSNIKKPQPVGPKRASGRPERTNERNIVFSIFRSGCRRIKPPRRARGPARVE